jgi:hypothetical protein
MTLLRNIPLRLLIPVFWTFAFFAPMTVAQESAWDLSAYHIGSDVGEAEINSFLGNDAVFEDDFGKFSTLSDPIGLYASAYSSVAQESPWDLPAYRIGAYVSEAEINLFLGKDVAFEDGLGNSSTLSDPIGLYASAYSSVGIILDENLEVGFNGLLTAWALNGNAADSLGQGAFAGLGFENLRMHARYYFNGIKPHAGFVPWGQVGFGELSHLRVGLAFDESLTVNSDDDLIDSAVLQVGEFDLSLDFSIGGSYRFSPFSSLDIEMSILEIQSVDSGGGGLPAGSSSSTEASVILADFHPSLHIGFSVWF